MKAPLGDTVNRDGLWPMPPGPPHEEQHFAQQAVVRDLVVGAADGPTLPFALVAGLSGLGAAPSLAVAAGLLAVAAGAIATGLGGYLATRAAADHYAAERRREEEETIDYEDRERWEVAAILHRYGVRGDALRLAVDSICADQRRWVDFMMRFELDLKEPEPQRALAAALATGGAHAAAGLLPVLPVLLMDGGAAGLAASAAVAAAALAVFGWLKARATGLPPLRGAVQGLATGGAAALGAILLARAVGG
ncbi:MAG TPA: VIT1/CCC1 transporter family protein [Roseomonas sp.]|nr:VIT1/CCC1 transporter family protein [Roseomonas sp.]